MKRILFFLLFIAISVFGNAQIANQYGILPSINLNMKFPKNWSGNVKVESRQSIYNQEFGFDYLLTDISFILTKRIATNTSAGMGYLMRVEDGEIKNRAIQQISLVKKYNNFRLAHRFMADQTFEQNDDMEFRLRYRLSSEIPLEGQSLDVNEFYLKVNNEYLNSFQGNVYDLEVRAVALIGYSLSPLNNFEIGADYRVDSFINANPRNRFWLCINFFQTIGK